MRRGMTLIEVLTVIAVIAVLVSILIPTLMSGRRGATAMKCAAQERTCQQSMSLYANDFGNSFPLFARPRISDAFTNGGISLGYYAQTAHWPIALRSYLGDRPLEEVWVCPGGPVHRAAFRNDGYAEYTAQYPPSYTHPSDYWLTYAAMSDPRAWTPQGAPSDPDLLRAVRLDEVAAPASKGILVEPTAHHLGAGEGFDRTVVLWEPEGAARSYLVAFSDGHVRAVPHRDLVPGWQSDQYPGFARAPVLATPRGILGRDVE